MSLGRYGCRYNKSTPKTVAQAMTEKKPNVLFIGLGVMGFPMAGHLVKCGYPITVANRSCAKIIDWGKTYNTNAFDLGPKSEKPQVEHFDVVISCLKDDQSLRDVFWGNAIDLGQRLKPGTLVIDHTTTSAIVSNELNQKLAEHGVQFLDAPVSGGQAGAENGQLTIMCGGDSQAYQTALPILECYAKKITLMGPSGYGQLTKMTNQIAIAGLIQGLSEALHFAEQVGLDTQKLIEAISKGAAQSWQMDNRASTMLKRHYKHGFAVDLMRKDLGICLEQARICGAKLPVTALVDQFYGDIQSIDGGNWDTSSLIERLRSK